MDPSLQKIIGTWQAPLNQKDYLDRDNGSPDASYVRVSCQGRSLADHRAIRVYEERGAGGFPINRKWLGGVVRTVPDQLPAGFAAAPNGQLTNRRSSKASPFLSM